MKKLIIILIILGVAVAAAVFFIPERQIEIGEVASFEDCMRQGGDVMESYPRQCRTADGTLFTEDIGNEFEKEDLIRVDNPRPNQIISSPIVVEGTARGFWFFEATFPIVVVDWDGKIIGEGYAEAEGEWMTTDFVPYSATIEFDITQISKEDSNRGTLILQKSNASGLPEHDDALEVPVVFGGQIGRVSGGCMITGCSSQVCSDREVMTTCEYDPRYACYQNIVCERQANGECGWTATPEFLVCWNTPVE